MKYKFIPFLISIGLTLVPFFWLKPGWLDLGGDSSRLYFYDPINYLKSFPLYVIAPTGTSVLMIGHHFIPFSLLLYLFKLLLFNSSYLLITLFNSMQLVVPFLSVYFITKELLPESNNVDKKPIRIFASTVAGLFYVLSPVLSPNGWDKAMIVHNQFFLNPLIFFLLLRFVHTKKILYMLLALLVTFLFASNFSPGPPPFAFFPLALFFLFVYSFIQKSSVPLKTIVVGGVLFLFLHAFHLVPQWMLFFSSQDNAYRQAALTHEGKIDRGLGYFTAAASTYKFVNNITSLPQGVSPVPVPKVLEPFWFIFPTILIVGFLVNGRLEKSERRMRLNFILLSCLFLATLFLATANVTHVGFELYKSFFNIPGFSMFRNYYGQFAFVFIFFYSLILGYALFLIFSSLNFKRTMFLASGILVLIIVSATPFLKGDMINVILNKGFTPQIGIAIKMDPVYEQALSYIRQYPIDGKLLSLPLTEGGHQIFAGKEGGAYDGPSTISYLTGKVDFAGRSGLNPFGELFLRLAREKDYESLKSVLSFLNVKYIFYNSDPYIFGEHFYRIPPYQEMHKYLPINQSSYKSFINQFDVITKKIDIGDKYHLHEVTTSYLPHIYAAKSLIKFDSSLTETPFPIFSGEDIRKAVIDSNAADTKGEYPFDETYLLAKQKNARIEASKKNPDVPVITSSVSPELLAWLFPFLALPQKATFPNEVKRVYDSYFDSNIYIAEEVIAMAEKENSLKGDTLMHYANLMKEVIDNFEKSQDPFIHSVSNEINMKRILARQENRIFAAIKKTSFSHLEKQELMKLSDEIFEELQVQLNNQYNQFITLTYGIDIPTDGFYDIYLRRDDIKKSMQNDVFLTVDDTRILPSDIDLEDHWIQFSGSLRKKEKINIQLSFPYYVDDQQKWKLLESKDFLGKDAVLLEGNVARDYVANVINAISVWEPNTLYLVSFDYQIDGIWKTYRAILESGDDTKLAFLQVLEGKLHSFDMNSPPSIEVKNLSVVKVPFPEIVVQKKETIKEGKTIPQIIFTKINPTKYKVQVKGARDPYVLVFLDAFNNNWKLFPLDNGSDKNQYSASYFQGDILEGMHTNSFLNTSTFEAWGKKAIAEDRHILVNGYANGWYILPSDTEGLSDYTLILEMTSQRVFYICFALSSLVFAVCCFWVLMLLSKKNK